MYTHKIQFFSGDSILISEKQAESIKEAITRGVEMIPIGNDLINVKSISRIGTHHATPQINKIEKNMLDINLVEAGRYDLVDKKRALLKAKTIEKAIHKQDDFMDRVLAGESKALKAYTELEEEPKNTGVISSDGGDYYLNEAGEKMYS